MFKLKCDDFLAYDEATGTYSVPKDQQVRDEHERKSWKSVGITLLKDWRLYLMLVPMLVVYLLWRYMPMTELLAVFKDPATKVEGAATDISLQNWYGLTNFYNLLFGSTDYTIMFWQAFRNTFIIAFYGLVFGFPFPIILALFFNEVRSNITRSIIQVCVYLPKFMSTVIITTLAIVLFKGPVSGGGSETVGLVSKLLMTLFPSARLEAAATSTYGLIFSPSYFRALYEITGIWEHGGYDSIVFFAAVIAVSPTSYEAAQIDGAGKIQQMRYVVIPSILSTVVIMLIMKVGSLLSVGYEKVYLMSNTDNYTAADIVATLANRWSTDGGNNTLGMTAEMVNNLIGMILVLGANAIAKRASDVSLY
ncbi:MAG: ABC transporter permease subunit [Candidatus Coproplasma sp.]